MFTESGGTWNQQQKLTTSDGDSRGLFGGSVAVSSDGTTALIGALQDEDPSGALAGSAYVFTESEGTWSQQQKLTATDGDREDLYGESVAVSSNGITARRRRQAARPTPTNSVAVSSDGTTALIGALRDENPNGRLAGAAYVFTESGGTWSQQQKLAATDGDSEDLFGFSVAVSSDGTTALIGAPGDEDPNGPDAGSVYVFTESGGTWSQQQKLTATDGDREDLFGESVAVSSDGTTALIGASGDEDPNGDNTGSAYVFTESEGTWSQQQKLAATDGDIGGLFGGSVAVSTDGTTALIGAQRDVDPNGPGAGSVYVFTESEGTWSQQQKLAATDGDIGGLFGGSVAVSTDGTTALIGAQRDVDPNGPGAGSVYVFTESEGTWSQQQKLAATDGDRRDRFGRSVAGSSDGTTALIGAFADEDPNGRAAGSAYVFTSDDAAPGGGAGPSVRATVQQPGTPGGQARVEYALANVSGQASVAVAFEPLPAALAINPEASDTTGVFDDSSLVFSDPTSSLSPTVAFDIAADLSPPTTVEIDTAVLDATGTTTDRVTTVLEITADSADSPLGGTAGEYDTNGDGTVTARELGAAVTDFGAGELSARELGEVVTAFGRS
ncbi:PKD domain-containing protein [Haloglomus irregulare]|uniref:PKD domain-containing protein n=1 Tax=Haloglomus irregulare TaxID=2234134 RepID=A0A554MUF2_9EURY|nr:PKD domain-containing protein [Haloglomus irregulare]